MDSDRTRLTYPDNTYVSYEYDTLNRMTYVKNSAGTALASYSFDERSRRTGLTYANGAGANYSYDTASRLSYIDNQTGNGQHKYSYMYDNVGNRTSMMVTDGSGVRTHVYTYDDIYQITAVDYPSGFDYLATDTTFNYDAAGNRTSVIDGSGTCSYTTNSLNEYTAAGTASFQYDSSGNMTHDNNYAYGYDPENRLVKVVKSGSLPTLTLAQALDSPLVYTTGGDGAWTVTQTSGHGDNDAAYSGYLDPSQSNWLQTTVQGAGTFSFYWKTASSDTGCELDFYTDGTLRSSIDYLQDSWQQKTYTITGTGAHTLKWTFTRSSSSNSGAGFVDSVQWTGSVPLAVEPAATAWKTLTYTYDASGRRIAKAYDGDTILKYVYDGDHCIAEYDAFGGLHRKYIYGPGVDEPICMIESAGSYAGTYYYHFDALGSVTALTNSSGNTVEVYEYDVYGRVGASDPNHPNRFMFTGREYDKETGLYYYRARYYNPQIGRFLQTDRVGYKAGMNLYTYCLNNPQMWTDPLGLYVAPPTVTTEGYRTADAAASAASAFIVAYQNWAETYCPGAVNLRTVEWFYWIYSYKNPWFKAAPDPCELYGFTCPIPAGKDAVDNRVALALIAYVPSKGTLAGCGHSHWKTGDPATDALNESFSPADTSWFLIVANRTKTVTHSYLLTPDHNLKALDVGFYEDIPDFGAYIDGPERPLGTVGN